MADIQFYLVEVDSNKAEAQRLAEKTAADLEARSKTILQIIESLGEYLNNEDVAIRSKTVAYLADVLTVLKSGVLSRQQRDLLCDFILSRVSNGAEGLSHCARGLQALQRLGRFDQEHVVSIVNALLNNTTPLTQFKQQSERFEVLKLFNVLLDSHRKQLNELHGQDETFLSRLVAYFDGEKDPRNLMIVFSILQVPMVEWDVSKDAKDLFEAVFNYFPITFRPPPNDPYGITAQDLKDRLRDCIASNSIFAPWAFPALLDKLDSTSANVKRDSLLTLKYCIERYGPATVHLYSITLWDAVKFEILNSQEEDLATEALGVLSEISYQLSLSSHESPLQTFLKPVGRECNEHLEDSPTKQSSASGNILGAISEASAESASILVKIIVPQIMQLYASADNIPKRRGLLEVLDKMLKSSSLVFGEWRAVEANPSVTSRRPAVNLRTITNSLDEYSSKLLDLLTLAVESTPITEVSYRMLALECVQSLALVRGLLDEEAISRICRMLDSIVIDEEPYGRDEVKAMAIEALVAVARQKPQAVVETTLPAFMAQLPDSDKDIAKPYVAILEAFAKLSAESQVFGTIVLRLKHKLYAALRSQASQQYVKTILSALYFAFAQGAVDLANPAIFGKYYQDIVIPLLKEVIAAGPTNFSESPATDDGNTFDVVGRICNLIVRPQPWQAQTEICRNTYILFRPVDESQIPPHSSSTRQSSLLMLTSTQIMGSLQQQATPEADIAKLLSSLVGYCQSSDLPPAILATTLTQISLVVNKHLPASQTSAVVVPHLFDHPHSLLSQPNQITGVKLRAAFAIIKALALRTDTTLSSIIPGILGLLPDPKHGRPTALLLAGLLSPDPMLTKENHCRVYGIHKQRLFSLVIPRIVALYRDVASAAGSVIDKERTKANHLTALAGLVHHVPYELVQTELESITPLLMQSLALEDPEVSTAAIATLSRIALEDANVLEPHVGTLVTRLLGVATATAAATTTGLPSKSKSELKAITRTPNQAPPRTRAAALACLGHLVGSLRDEAVVPYQRQVVKRLANALDDGRRAVRAEAVRCRALWTGLAGGDDEDDD